jgi:hypothetical protein
MGPPENLTPHLEKQKACGRKTPVRRPRARRCLLKGCERSFHPRHPRQRYCSEDCREAAREWSEWKAQHAYRATPAGKEKRNGQSRRYRKRVKERQSPEKETVAESARVITRDFFSTAAATGLAATNASCARGGRPCSGSARRSAGARWSAFGNGSGAGDTDTPGAALFLEVAHGRGSHERRTPPAMSLTY